MNKIICIIGPTASGKSDIALELAQKFSGQIINADSRQFYEELNIGTAKPDAQMRQKVPHHLIDCAHISQPWSVGHFVKSCEQAIQNIVAQKQIPIVVGGTGMYVKSLLFGLAEIPEPSEKIKTDLQSELAEFGLEKLYQKLQDLDPLAAARLKPSDTQRITRALEVFLQTGKSIEQFWQTQKNSRYDFLKIGINWERSVLYERINQRVQNMFAKGLKAEAKVLFDLYPDNLLLAKTIGYAEWAKSGFESDELVLQAIQTNSRHFAKRQLTWFRGESDIHWFAADELGRIEVLISDFLSRDRS